MTAFQANMQENLQSGESRFGSLHGCLKHTVALTSFVALTACGAKAPDIDTAAGCFTAIAFSSEPLYFPTDLKRWERALDKSFEKPAVREKIDAVVAELDELEDSAAHLRKLAKPCGDVLESLEAVSA